MIEIRKTSHFHWFVQRNSNKFPAVELESFWDCLPAKEFGSLAIHETKKSASVNKAAGFSLYFSLVSGNSLVCFFYQIMWGKDDISFF